MKDKIETRCIHIENEDEHPYGAISYPIFQTATFAHPGMGPAPIWALRREHNR